MIKKEKSQFGILRIFVYFLLVIIAFFQMMPFYLAVINSFQPKGFIKQLDHLALWPESFNVINYANAWRAASIGTGYINTVIYVSIYTFVSGFIAMLVGYVLAKKKFKGRKIIFVVLISTMMVPSEILLVPNFVLIRNLGLLNKLTALIIPGLVDTFGIFLAKQFMDGLPNELIESAYIDGAGELKIFNRIILPNSKAAFSTYIILTFSRMWNDYLWPMIVLSDHKKFPVQLCLQVFRNLLNSGVNQTYQEILTDASMIMTILPPVIIFLIFQKKFINGMVLSGLK